MSYIKALELELTKLNNEEYPVLMSTKNNVKVSKKTYKVDIKVKINTGIAIIEDDIETKYFLLTNKDNWEVLTELSEYNIKELKDLTYAFK